MATTKTYDKRLTVDVRLDMPVTVDAVSYDMLTIRRPNVKDSMTASHYSGTDIEQTVKALSNLCSFKGDPVGPDVLEALDEVDFLKLAEQRAAFTGR